MDRHSGACQRVRAKRGPMTGSASNYDVQLHIGESRDSGSGATHHPRCAIAHRGMTKRDSEITIAQSPASWFETRGMAARLTMRVGDPHPEERALARVSKDAAAALENALAGKFSRQHLFQDLPADGLVGERRLAPPPAVPLHLFGRGDKAISHLRKIRIAVIQAEDQPAGADPDPREP